jgi:DNA mismatch endonuclease (patch repair protein)
MERQRRRDTRAEMAVRRRVHAMGLRYRVDVAPIASLRRRADLVFTRAHVAVFVDGCFWHGCPNHGTWPKENADWWKVKIATNQSRDVETTRRLEDAGWTVLRIWEHEDPESAARMVAEAVKRSGHHLEEAGG